MIRSPYPLVDASIEGDDSTSKRASLQNPLPANAKGSISRLMIIRIVSVMVLTLTLVVLAPAAQQQAAPIPITERD